MNPNFASHLRYIVGVDEAGRGPIAGPVAVGAVAIPIAHAFPDGAVRDSKALPQHKREAQFSLLKTRALEGGVRYAVAQTGSQTIDRIGIVRAIDEALKRALKRLALSPHGCLVLLDGGLRAPAEFPFQETIIKGDERVYAIALASIAAKVTRDATMRRLSWRYPAYGFEQHKGYGTHEHYKLLKKNGLSVVHRKSFLKGLTDGRYGVE